MTMKSSGRWRPERRTERALCVFRQRRNVRNGRERLRPLGPLPPESRHERGHPQLHMKRETTFDLLSSSVRRRAIAVLHEAGSMSPGRLAAVLAAEKGETPDEAARRRTRIALHHNHLPRLAEAGLVTTGDSTVAPTSRLDDLARAVALLDVDEALRDLDEDAFASV